MRDREQKPHSSTYLNQKKGHVAARHRDAAMIELLVARCNVSPRREGGRSALMLAEHNRRVSAAAALRAHGSGDAPPLH